MNNLTKAALSGTCWAVAGATVNPEKFGYRIYMRLKNAGYKTYAVNPGYTSIDGDVCYASVLDLPETPDCVSMVIAPDKGAAMLEALKQLGVKTLWFQPGAYDQAIIKKAETMGFSTIYGPCVLVELNQLGR